MQWDHRNLLAEGTRSELIDALEELRIGADHLGKPKLASEAHRGITELLTGASSVRVGVMTYDVTETAVTGTVQ
jgi:hypothetical protein